MGLAQPEAFKAGRRLACPAILPLHLQIWVSVIKGYFLISNQHAGNKTACMREVRARTCRPRRCSSWCLVEGGGRTALLQDGPAAGPSAGHSHTQPSYAAPSAEGSDERPARGCSSVQASLLFLVLSLLLSLQEGCLKSLRSRHGVVLPGEQ